MSFLEKHNSNIHYYGYCPDSRCVRYIMADNVHVGMSCLLGVATAIFFSPFIGIFAVFPITRYVCNQSRTTTTTKTKLADNRVAGYWFLLRDVVLAAFVGVFISIAVLGLFTPTACGTNAELPTALIYPNAIIQNQGANSNENYPYAGAGYISLDSYEEVACVIIVKI